MEKQHTRKPGALSTDGIGCFVHLSHYNRQVQDTKTMSSMYERFVAMAEKKHACPLCSRGFDTAFETQFTTKVRRSSGLANRASLYCLYRMILLNHTGFQYLFAK